MYDTRDVRYQVRYAVSSSVYGPYEAPESNIVICPAGEISGTGHASLTLYQDEWYLFYHRMGQGKTGYDRQVCCDKWEFVHGHPVPIVPTDGGSC
nr:family 43 glycosylhydrolase [Paenibacillus thalictri]